MEYIVEQSLPPASLATPLGQSLKQSRPDLNKLLNDFKVSQSQFGPKNAGCTPFEARVLTLNGWSQRVSQIPGQALAAWQLEVAQSSAPVWAAQLCSTQIGTSAATLHPLSTLELSHDDALSLCEAAQPSFGHKDDAIWVEAITASTWRVHAPLAELAHTVSPEALAGQNIAGWWPDSDAWLAWRRILNEIQMVWHDHPVNEARLERGLPAVNSVWLYGGAHGWQPLVQAQAMARNPAHKQAQSLLQPQTYQLISTLRPFVMSSDWSGWLEAWLKNVLPLVVEMQKGSAQASTPTHLTLTGQDRLVTLTHLNQNQPNWLKKLARPFTKNDWSTWWHNPS